MVVDNFILIKINIPPSRVSSEGEDVVVVWRHRFGKHPLRLAFQAREGVVVLLENTLLRLTFRARRGGGMVGKHPPLSRVLSEGGGGVVGKVAWLGNIPLRLTFRVREGVVVWLGNISLRLTF